MKLDVGVFARLPDLVVLDWRRKVDEAFAVAGGIASLHSSREEVLGEYKRYGTVLAEMAKLAETPAEFSAAAEKLRTFIADLAARWTTELDLEDIVCRAATPPADELRRKLAKLPGPPKSWWEMGHKKPW